MEVAVFDTYVRKPNGGLMHFDILVESKTESEKVLQYGKAYLSQKGFNNLELTTKECKFCHVENPGENVTSIIKEMGYAIIEMQGC